LIRDAERLLSELRARLPNPLPSRLGVAVSGGSDSTALLHLLSRVTEGTDTNLFAATVDHGLRSEAAEEAAEVAALCRRLEISHTTLKWGGWDGSGNLQDQARRARYRLLRDWARAHDIPAVTLGHTADDQAETVLMRLGRAAGVTGLSAMPMVRAFDGVDLVRPLLFATRAELQGYLLAHGVDWTEDPSTQNIRFDRLKARQSLAQLAELGISAKSLARVAENMGHANTALAQYTQETAQRLTVEEAGSIRLDCAGFAGLPKELQRRIVIGIVRWIAGGDYPPRQASVDRTIAAVSNSRPATIGGCTLVPNGDFTWFCRELNPVVNLVAPPGLPWDRRWIVSGPDIPGAQIRALAESGLKQLPDWRTSGLPRAALLATPAVWVGQALVSAPLGGLGHGWTARFDPAYPSFTASFLSH